MYKVFEEASEYRCKPDNPYCDGPLATYVHKDHPEWMPYIKCDKHGKQLVEGWVKV